MEDISAEKSKSQRSKGRLSLRDHDAREKIDRAILTGKDGIAGKLAKQMKGRLNKVEKELESIQIKKEKRLGIRLSGTQSGRNFLIDLPQNFIMLGEQKKLCYPDLLITPHDRIAFTGPNGSGKSTLILSCPDFLFRHHVQD